MSTAFRLQLPVAVRDGMVAQARAELPNECVGWLAGRIAGTRGIVRKRYAFANALASPREFSAEPADLFAAHKDMRRLGLELLAIYHSHPTSRPVPSRTDLERNFWGPGIVNFIISLEFPTPRLRGWRLDADSFRPAEWELVVSPRVWSSSRVWQNAATCRARPFRACLPAH
ncbi:MAG: M67 family metallopeptidase [Gemmataceae bacterium]